MWKCKFSGYPRGATIKNGVSGKWYILITWQVFFKKKKKKDKEFAAISQMQK